MTDCPHCGASNREGSRFCAECGKPLGAAGAVACPMCDTPNAPGAIACINCGARLLPLSVSTSEGEPQLIEVESAELVVGEAKEEEKSVEPEEPKEEKKAVEPEEPEEEEKSVEPEEPVEETVEEGPSGFEPPSKERMPPWAKKLGRIPVEEVPPEPSEEAAVAPGELPAWLEVPAELEEMLSEAAPAAEEELPRGEIPAWLEALRPEEEVGEPAEPVGPVEVTGLLKGIRSALPVEPILAIPRRASPLTPFSPSGAALERADVFDEVVREPARPSAEIARPRRMEMLLASTIRWLIYLIVAVAVMAPVLLGSNWAAANMTIAPSTVAAYDLIDNLPAGAVVLVSHDYDPGVAAEMTPQAQVVLHHLMEREARLINVSLTPEGSRLSRRVLEEVADAQGYVYGEDYLNLGYVVGVEAGPRSIVENLPRVGGGDFVEGSEDIALVVEFAGAPQYLRLWLEQVQGPYQLPMVAGVSATVDPFARPYYLNHARRQLSGLVTGLVGAAEYERYSGRPGAALRSMDSQSVVHIAIVLLVVLGNVAYFGGRLRGRSGK